MRYAKPTRIVKHLGYVLPALMLMACGDLEPNELQESCDHEPEYQVYEQEVVDCTERQDTGYVRGNSYPITVVTVDGKPVETNTANAFWLMQEAAKAEGVSIKIVSGFRTNAQQTYLYNCYLNQNCNNGNLAARPGYSNHQSGLALDLNTSVTSVFNWLTAKGGNYGFRRTVPSEKWHWEWKGGTPDGGICGIVDGCETAIPSAGGEVDNGGACFQAYGPSQYWRKVTDAGVGGGLIWTNAYEADAPSCWARWFINAETAGTYQVEISRTAEWFVYNSARYTVRAGGKEETVYMDQSAGDENWQILGVYDFAAGEDQWVSVYDNVEGAVAADQHVGADAIRLVPYVEPEPEPEVDPELPDPIRNPELGDPIANDGTDPEYPDSQDPDDQLRINEDGCSAVGAAPSLWSLLLILGWRRRKSR